MEKEIYLISGLGADERIFALLDFGEYQPRYIKWIEPYSGEKIRDYASRLKQQIATENPIILGVSFGGMIAVEIAKQIDCKQVILISSAKAKKEIPMLYRILGCINVHKLAPTKLLKRANFITYWFFGMNTKVEKELLKSILRDTDTNFLRWAINSIVKWDNEYSAIQKVQIHGTRDRILPIQNIKEADYKIKDGGHLMVYNQANKINSILQDILLKVSTKK